MENHTFTHTPRAPHILSGYEDQRNFAMRGRDTGMHIGIRRMGHEDTAELRVSTWGRVDVRAEVMSRLTADECEALARALVDAAHDLRTHNSIEALHRAIVAAEGAAS